MPANDRVHIYRDDETLRSACADYLCVLAQQTIGARGACHLVLAGGSTPRGLYQLLATPPYRERLDWARLHVWFGDERAVPHDHPDSNYRMAHSALLGQVPIPPGQIHPMAPVPDDMAGAAAAYQAEIEQLVPHDAAGVPRFDIALLGIGPDGHTASLFPDTAVLAEERRLVAPVYVERLASWRLTLTYPVLEQARQLLFLVAGADKAAVIARLFQGTSRLPAARLQARPNAAWFLDRAAAGELTHD